MVIDPRSGTVYWFELQLHVDVSGQFEVFQVFLIDLQVGMVAKAEWQCHVWRIFHKYLHFQRSLRKRVKLSELRNALHYFLRHQFYFESTLRWRDGDVSLVVDTEPMQRQTIPIEIVALDRQEGILLYPIDPWKHEIAARSQAFFGLLQHSLARQVQPHDASTFRIQLHPILIVQFHSHIQLSNLSIQQRYITVGYIILVSTMEQQIAEIQQLYDRIPQQLIAELTTSLEDYALPAQQLQLQSSFDEDALNSLVAGLLEREDLPRFQFLVEGRLLRGQLKSHILRHELTAEQTLHIEYVVSFPNLSAHQQQKEEDWIASIAVLPGPETNVALAAALYNGSIAFYDLGLKQLGKVKVDQDPLKSTAVMIGSQQGSYFCLSGGMGELLKIHLVDAGETFKASPLSSNAHNGSINIIAVSPGPDSHFATAGSQGELSIWQIPEGFEQLGSHNAVKSKKKKKEANLNVLPLLASAQVSQGSIECAGWLNNEEVVTGSSQHRMTITNITRMAASETFLTRDSVVSSLDCTDTLIISAHEDGQIRLWDRRVSSKPSSTFKAHSKWTSSVRFNPRLPHHFCSGSHDRTLKLWDARCGFPLQNIQAQQEKVLATEWAGEQQVVSGGSDAKLHLHSAR